MKLKDLRKRARKGDFVDPSKPKAKNAPSKRSASIDRIMKLNDVRMRLREKGILEPKKTPPEAPKKPKQSPSVKCPACGSTKVTIEHATVHAPGSVTVRLRCKPCDNVFDA